MQTATLTRAELEQHDPTGGKGGRWLCPLPACTEHTDPRRHRSLSVVESSGLWQCHRCHGQGQLKDAWKPFQRKTWKEKEAQEQARRRQTLTRAIETYQQPQLPPVPVEKLRGVAARLGQLVKLSSTAGRAGQRYIQGRGFTSPDALALLDASGVRFSHTFGQREAEDDRKAWKGTTAIVFPVRDHHGNLTAAQGRLITPSEGMPKVLTFGDRNRGAFVTPGALEALEKGLPVAIAEAPFDALALALCGLPALALCGCSGLPEWITRRAFNRRFFLAFDGDGAGDEAADKLASELRGMGGMVSRLRPGGAKDFNEALQTIGPDALRALIAREAGGNSAMGNGIEAFGAAPAVAEARMDSQPPSTIEYAEYGGKRYQLEPPLPGSRGPRDAEGKLLPLDLEGCPPSIESAGASVSVA